MASQTNEQLCPDWVYVNASNVHVAKDRGWFTSYTPFKSTLHPLYGGDPTPVHGIGTVEICVKASLNSSSENILVLDDVLHAPEMVCNVLGGQLEETYLVSLEAKNGTMEKITNGNIEPFGFFEPDRPGFILAIVTPHGRELGPPVVVEGEQGILSCSWDPKEEHRWKTYRAKHTGAGEAFLKKGKAILMRIMRTEK